MKTFSDFNISVTGSGQVATRCPQCAPQRKKHPNAKPLSVNIDEGVWKCHHCGWSGSLRQGEERRSRPNDWKPKVYRRPTLIATQLDDQAKKFFLDRHISLSICEQYGITSMTRYLPSEEEECRVVVFPFLRGGDVINAKYRGINKKVFTQEWDAEKIVFGLQGIDDDSTTVIITEGELDVLACATAGIHGAVSVPDGAPAPNSKPSEVKFEYLVNCQSFFERMTKIILAVDGDAPGEMLEQELARRLGIERCWRVKWPDGCKDANDVLMKLGASGLQEVIAYAKPWPIENLVTISDVLDRILQARTMSQPRGMSTGWSSLDLLYTVGPGDLTIVTGMPNHGKSEFMDALIQNLCVMHEWQVAFCSPENVPVERHIMKHIEKYANGPFYGSNAVPPLTEAEVIDAAVTLDQYMAFIVPEESLTIESLLWKAKALVFQRGIRGFVIDPWNEFDHRRAPGLSETEHISASLGLLRRFARNTGVHVWVVAHPAKMHARDDGSYPIPRPYDISGSAHWYNRADNCLSIWRDVQRHELKSYIVVAVQKVRNKYFGTKGMTALKWDPVSGRLNDEQPEGGYDYQGI